MSKAGQSNNYNEGNLRTKYIVTDITILGIIETLCTVSDVYPKYFTI